MQCIFLTIAWYVCFHSFFLYTVLSKSLHVSLKICTLAFSPSLARKHLCVLENTGSLLRKALKRTNRLIASQMALVEVSSYFCASQMPQVKGPAGSCTTLKKQQACDIMRNTLHHMITHVNITTTFVLALIYHISICAYNFPPSQVSLHYYRGVRQ